MKKSNIRGFTLTELSIVLVIIGLLVGGTMAGVELVKSAALKSMISKVDEYKSAVSQFEQLYEALPGDMRTATSYWPSTTNGDGNRKITGENGAEVGETVYEAFKALQHMALAEVISGSFTGAWGSGFSLGNNVPAIGNTGASVYVRCCSGSDYARSISFNNYVALFSVYAQNDDFRGGILTPTQAFNIDKKLDDGIPDNGLVGASAGYSGSVYSASGCYSGSGASSTYNAAIAVDRDKENCQMQFAYDWN